MNVSQSSSSISHLRKAYYSSWWGKLLAGIAVINLLLVGFNLSYLPLRDIYWQRLPIVLQWYDPVKGIEPHPGTQRYLETVATLKHRLQAEGLDSSASRTLLKSLQDQSMELLAENPFLSTGKLATFAKLQRRMEYELETRSALAAFYNFWSVNYFASKGPTEAIAFFEDKIEPLLATNYWRNVDEYGLFVDRFVWIDCIFSIVFGVELLGRTLWLAQQQPNGSWLSELLRCWYDGLLLLPFWRWLRIIPVTVRLHQSRWLNLEPIVAQVTYEPAAYLAERTSMFLMVRLINQARDAVATGELADRLLNPSATNTASVGPEDKVDRIVDRFLELAIYRIVPQVEPEVKALLQHSLRETLTSSDVYQTLRNVPGFQTLPTSVTETLADYLSASVYNILISTYSDEQGRAFLDALNQRFRQALRLELQSKTTQTELQSLIADLLEELKLNYLQTSQQHDPESTMAEANQLQQDLTPHPEDDVS